MMLRDYLQERGISNHDFAAEVDVTIYAVRKWLNGERVPRDKTKAKIARITKNKVKIEDWLRGL